MFHDMPGMPPGTQITKSPHIIIHASQPGFRNRASDRLVDVPPSQSDARPEKPRQLTGTPARKSQQPRPQINGPVHEKRTFHCWCTGILCLLHQSMDTKDNIINERTPATGTNNVSTNLRWMYDNGCKKSGRAYVTQIRHITMSICIKTKWHTVLRDLQTVKHNMKYTHLNHSHECQLTKLLNQQERKTNLKQHWLLQILIKKFMPWSYSWLFFQALNKYSFRHISFAPIIIYQIPNECTRTSDTSFSQVSFYCRDVQMTSSHGIIIRNFSVLLKKKWYKYGWYITRIYAWIDQYLFISWNSINLCWSYKGS